MVLITWFNIFILVHTAAPINIASMLTSCQYILQLFAPTEVSLEPFLRRR
jgi:hypothetical protein